MLNKALRVFLLVLLTTGAMAQQQSDRFLADVFGINTFKINSTLKDIQNDKKIAEHLTFFNKVDNRAVYFLSDQKINLPGLKALDRLEFDTLELVFENNKLHDVELHVPGHFKNLIITKTCDQFNAKYGQSIVVDLKNGNYKMYSWNLDTNELTLNSYTEGLFLHYASKISNKQIGWIYADRKGKGDDKIQLNLPYFEKLLTDKLTVTSFEKFLPQWETKGVLNHVYYMPNFKTLVDNSPNFSITYLLNSYDINIQIEDTTSKIISEFGLEKIKDTKVWSQFEKDLNNLNYKIGPKLKYSRNITYSNRKFLVFLDKEDSRIAIKSF
jgi:hypothetical protein